MIYIFWTVIISLFVALIVCAVVNSRKQKNIEDDDGKTGKIIRSRKFGIVVYSILALTCIIVFGSWILLPKLRIFDAVEEINARQRKYSETMKNTVPDVDMPESFYQTVVYIDDNAIPAYTNGRYYIYCVSNHWYIREEYIDSFIDYSSSVMSGSGVMEDIEARGKYVEGVNFQHVEPEAELESVPAGFQKVVIDNDGIKCISYENEYYSIEYMIYHEYEDWYISKKPGAKGTPGRRYIRYEPSFMTGAE